MTPQDIANAIIGTVALHMPDVYLKAYQVGADAISKAIAEEREACAKLAEEEYHLNEGGIRGLPEIHTAIRARKP